jgi:hypothetical protein
MMMSIICMLLAIGREMRRHLHVLAQRRLDTQQERDDSLPLFERESFATGRIFFRDGSERFDIGISYRCDAKGASRRQHLPELSC